MIVEPHEVVRRGLVSLLSNEDDIQLVSAFESFEETTSVSSNLTPDILLFDYYSPDNSGIETIRFLNKKFPKSKKILFTFNTSPSDILPLIEMGIDGLLSKKSNLKELIDAIDKISKGKKYYSNDVSASIIETLQNKKISDASLSLPTTVVNKLSKKEIEILKLIANGMKSNEVASMLNLSVRTVSNHRANMLRKTDLKNTAELIRAAMKEGVI